MGFISCHRAQILHNNSLINLHCIEAARQNRVNRYLYTWSASVYPEYKGTETNCVALEENAYPAAPQDAYGCEKLVSERLCVHYREDYGLETRILRFHNIFGPLGTWQGDERKRRRRCAARLQRHNSKVLRKLKFGVMASKRGPSATSMTASWGYTS